MLNLYDIRGRFVGSIGNPNSFTTIQALVTPSPIKVMYNNQILNIATGFYYAIPSKLDTMSVKSFLSKGFGFEDVTSSFLPSQQWDAVDIATFNVNRDGKEDIIFSLNRVYCDSITDKRPRVWVQTDQGQFVDETEMRIPPGRYAADQIILFDCDNDSDIDIFLTGWGCNDGFPSATLLINNGAGVFTDESITRLPSSHLIYSAAVGQIDNNISPDLLVVDWTPTEPTTRQFAHPLVWLNNGNGVFTLDTLGRFKESDYGYFIPIIVDVNKDTHNDVAFANMKVYITQNDPTPRDSLSGQTALYINNGEGFFEDETAERIPSELTSSTRKLANADIDRDNDEDLVQIIYQSNPESSYCRLLLNDGTGHFSVAPNAFGENIAGWFNDVVIGTLNDDQYPDMFLPRVIPGQVYYDVLLINNGNGSFSDSSSLLPSGADFSTAAAFFDHENDGDEDIIIANCGPRVDTTGQNVLYHNTLYTSVSVHNDEPAAPKEFRLWQCYPNPFNPTTNISFSIPQNSLVSLNIFDLLGSEVAKLINEEMSTGSYSKQWNAEGLPSGVYFCRLQAGSFVASKKLVLLR